MNDINCSKEENSIFARAVKRSERKYRFLSLDFWLDFWLNIYRCFRKQPLVSTAKTVEREEEMVEEGREVNGSMDLLIKNGN